MLVGPALTVLGVFVILVVAEYLSRMRRPIHSELTRKFVHMSVSIFVSTWPLYLKWWEIGLLSLSFLLVVTVSIQFNALRSIHSVNRRSLGEVMFALAIGFLALLDGSQWIFMVAMLHLGLADGLAAIVGLYWGKRTRYEVFGYPKSRAGTAMFFAVSLVIMLVYVVLQPSPDWWLLALVPPVATLAENVGVFGTDNLLVPAIVAGMLHFF